LPIENEHIEAKELQQLLYETRSEEVQEIMGRMPSWIIRWGIMVVGFIVIGLFIGSYFIKYPDRVNATISITSDNPPVKIVSPNTGRLQRLFVQQNDTVSQNDMLLILENQAIYEDVVMLKKRTSKSIIIHYEC
jgi:multidrug efflux pump subunit AcrA (membrane-fusion protein)